MGNRRRCTECRCSFTPSPRAAHSQRACGPACRAARDRKLARARRRREIDAHREDDRRRQQETRARRTAAAPPAPVAIMPARHAPPSAPKDLDSQKQIDRIVARVMTVSRATLERELARITVPPRSIVAGPRPASRATFRPQALDPAGESSSISGPRHAP